MNILAVESSTQACSASLLTESGVYTQFEMAPQKHADLMLPMVETVLAEAEITGEALDYLALSEGPGAFTGIRIAAGVIQGLALGWEKPVISVSTLEAIGWQAMQQTGQKECWVCLDARMKEIYLQRTWLEAGRLCSEPAQMLSEQAVMTLLEGQTVTLAAGDIDREYPELIGRFAVWETVFPSAEGIAQIAAQRVAQAETLDQSLPLPVYLRNNVAETIAERQARQQQA